jgi:hypothetical protein
MRFIPKNTYSKVNSRRVSIISLRLDPKDCLLERHKYSLFLERLFII